MKQHSKKTIMTGFKTIGIFVLLILLSSMSSLAKEVPCDKPPSTAKSGANSERNDVGGVKDMSNLPDQSAQQDKAKTNPTPPKSVKSKRRMVGDDEFGIEF